MTHRHPKKPRLALGRFEKNAFIIFIAMIAVGLVASWEPATVTTPDPSATEVAPMAPFEEALSPSISPEMDIAPPDLLGDQGFQP